MIKSNFKIIEFLLNLIFPPRCAVCGCFGKEIMCEKCVSKIVFLNSRCRDERLFVPTSYEGVMKKAIKKLKFKGKKQVAAVLGKILSENMPFDNFDCVIPVPLHKNRMKERGFNQAELLSIPIAEKYSKDVYSGVLIRSKETKRQFDLKREERINNVKDAFMAVNAVKIKNKKILLVDDIYTTGSTMRECSKCLMSNGAKIVYCLSLSRAIEL